MLRLAVVVALFPVLVGCVAEASASCPSAEGRSANYVLPGTATRTPVAQMSVFGRPRGARDAFFGDSVALRSNPSAVCEGCRLLWSRSRRLLAAPGSRSRVLYAVPVSDGNVCWELVPQGAAACTGFSVLNGQRVSTFEFTVWDEGGPSKCDPAYVAGVAPDRVSAVHVVVRGRRHRAQLHSNGFFYELRREADSKAAVSAVIFRLTSGGTYTKKLR